MLYLQLPLCYNFTILMRFGINDKTFKNLQVHHKFYQPKDLILANTGLLIWHLLILLWISIHCPVFDIYDSNIMKIVYYYYVLLRIIVAFKLMDKKIGNNNIYLMPISTMDLDNCSFMLHI